MADRCAPQRKRVEETEKDIEKIDAKLKNSDDLNPLVKERLEKERDRLASQLRSANAGLEECLAATGGTHSKKKKTTGTKKR